MTREISSSERAHLGRAILRRVDMIKARRRAQKFGGGGETAFMRGEGVGVQHILAGQILHMDEGVGAAHACGETTRSTGASGSPFAP